MRKELNMPIFSEGRVLPAPSRADRNIQNASTGHCTAFAVLGKGAGTRMQAESKLELDHLRIQCARPDVADVQEQVLFLYGRRDDQRHVFDMVVTKTGGARIAYTVKPEIRLGSGDFVEKMQTVAWWVRDKGFARSIRLLTEADIDHVALYNANFNFAAYDQDHEADEAARTTARDLRGAVTIKRLTERIGLKERGYRALLRLISAGELKPAFSQHITPETLIEWKGTRK